MTIPPVIALRPGDDAVDNPNWTWLEMTTADMPLWARTAAIDEKGDVVVPGEFAADVPALIRAIRASTEPFAVATIEGSKRIFVRIAWLATTFPEAAADLRAIETSIREVSARMAH